MKNKRLIQIMFVGMGLLILTLIMALLNIDRTFIAALIILGVIFYKISSLVLLVKNGTTINSKYLNYFKLSVVFTLLGAFMNIMTWPFSGTVILIGFIAGWIIYFVRFFTKPEKGLLDFLKVLWLGIAYVGSYGKLHGQYWGDMVIFAGELPYLIMVFYFIQTEKKAGTLYNR